MHDLFTRIYLETCSNHVNNLSFHLSDSSSSYWHTKFKLSEHSYASDPMLSGLMMYAVR